MKKSFDYFKTLKEMSEAVGDAYSSVLGQNEFNKELIRFSGLKFELSDNLVNEFVAPIERNDIYNLSYMLNEEMYYINKLNNILLLLDTSFSFAQSFENGFNKQNRVFDMLFDSKNYEKILKYINESRAFLNGLNTSIILSFKKTLRCADRPLLYYTAVSCFSELFKSVEKTFYEVERVIINNS